jgi:CRISPR-associated protein Cmr3
MTSWYFIRPLDVISIRGNRSFGGSGEYGEAIMPPWPSLFAGALRSAMLGRDSAALAAFGPKKPQPAGALGEVLGTPERPGTFRLQWASLGRIFKNETCEAAIPLPADLVALKDDNTSTAQLHWLRPSPLPTGVRAAFPLPLLPLLRSGQRAKTESGRFLTGKLLEKYISGNDSLPSDSLHIRDLYQRETRVGIGMNNGTGTVEDGALYSTEVVSFQTDCGFLVEVCAGGVDPSRLLPGGSLLRLGGDGKGAVCQLLPHFSLPPAPLAQIEQNRGFRLVLTSPGIFMQGWLPDGVQGTRLEGEGFSAELVCAAVSRAGVISGWDLAKWEPKPAQRVAPAGSVYWFNDFKGDTGKLAKWVAGGLWSDNPDEQRRAEGFNRALLAAWV